MSLLASAEAEHDHLMSFTNSLIVIRCWMNETAYTNILVAPVVISMILNLLFLCNIVRVLLLKLKAPAGPQGSAPSRNILQAFR